MNRNLSDWVDYTVRAKDGDVGAVERFYFDDLTWSVRYLAVDMGGGPPGRAVLLSVAALEKPDDESQVFPVNLTLQQVRSSPAADVDEPVSRQHELELREHYAWPGYWDGGFYIPPAFRAAAMLAGEAAAERSVSGVRKVDPHLHSTWEIKDCGVHATDGNIGHVEDGIVDDETWSLRYLVVNTRNWLPNRRVLVSPQWIRSVDWAGKQVVVDLSREAVKKSPRYNPAKPVSAEYEEKLRGHLQKTDVAEWVIFRIRAPPGSDVHVAGTFNNWNPSSITLGHHGKGNYSATVLLPMGRHEYKFIVNGVWRNGPDGGAQVPNPYGTTNSMLVVDRTTVHDAHLHTFARTTAGNPDRLMWSTPMGG